MSSDKKNDQTRSFVVLGKGTMVHHYRIIEKIGAGGMGEVYLADDTKLNRQVALKFMPSALATDDDLRARFTREAQALAQLDHPNVVTIYEVSEHDGRPFFAMQFIDGKDLHVYCRGNLLPVDKVITLVEQVASGLSRAHAAGVIHRDIKSSNVVVDSDFRPRILDFGLATVRGGKEITKVGSTLGTVSYMSPEQARGEEVDHRSDLFSLGVVLYELLTGRTPFARNSDAATLRAIVDDRAEPLAAYKAEMDPELERIVAKLLAKSPAERYQSAGDLSADLRTLVRSADSRDVEATGATGDSGSSIAVLPFANMSADPENEFFSDGLTEELLNVLAKNPELKVTGRTSSFAFKGKQEDLRAIGQKLGVQNILEGSVRKAGNRIRITAQLVKSSDGFHLWSETYDRVLDDVFEVQDDIANEVAKALHVTLLGKSRERHVGNLESYELLLKGQQMAMQWNQESVQEAIELLKKAIDLEPNSARIWAAIARVWVLQAAYGFEDNQVAYRKAKDAALKAVELDDQLAEGHEVLGLIRLAIEFHFDEAEREFRKAYKLAPNSSRMVSSLAMFLGAMGEVDEALRMTEHALELDPLNPESHLNRGRLLIHTRRFAEARFHYLEALELSPQMASVNVSIGGTYHMEGDFDKALAYTSMEPAPGYRNCGLAILYHAMGKREESDAALKYLLDQSDSHSWAYQIAMIYAMRGERDEAFEWLERGRAIGDAGIPHTKASIFFESLHDDPRWPALLQRIGYSD